MTKAVDSERGPDKAMIFPRTSSFFLLCGIPTFLLFTFFFSLDIDNLYRRLRATNHGTLRQTSGAGPQDFSTLSNTVNIETSSKKAAQDSPAKLPAYLLIDDYAKWHTENRRHGRKLIYRCPRRACGGIGDRLRGIVQLYLLAVVNQRVFLIDWDDPYPLTDALSPNKIDWVFKPDIDSPPWDVIPQPWEKKSPIPPSFQYGTADPIFSLDNHTLIMSERQSANLPRVINASNAYFKPLLIHSLRHIHSWTLFRMIIQALFNPSKCLKDRLYAVAKDFSMRQPYLAVHARVGAGVNELESYGGRFNRYAGDLRRTATRLIEVVLAEWSDLEKVMEVDERNKDGLCCIFFATDTPAMREVFVNELRKRNDTIRVVGGEWTPRHFIEARRARVEDGVVEVDSEKIEANKIAKDTFVDSMLDLYLIARASTVVHLPSVFTNVAFWLGNSKRSVGVSWGPNKDDMVSLGPNRARSMETQAQEKLLKRFQTVGRMPWEDEYGSVIKTTPKNLLDE